MNEVIIGALGLISGGVTTTLVALWQASGEWNQMKSKVQQLEKDSEKVDKIPVLIEKIEQLIERIDGLADGHEHIRDNFIDRSTCEDRISSIKERIERLENQ